MFSSTGIPAIRSEWTNWHLLFASQPEPDLEFTEEDLDEPMPPPTPPMNSPKRSGKRPLLWILLLLLVGAIGYVAMDPDGVMQLVEPYLEGRTDTAPPAAQKPPVTAQTPTQPPTVAPPIPPALPDSGSPAPADVPTPSSASPAATTPEVAPAPPIVSVADPRFSEGQRVTVIPDPNRPKSPMPLFVDSVGTKTSTTVLAGTTLTIRDGDYQKNGWVYAVRTQDGRKGWIPERNLKLKR